MVWHQTQIDQLAEIRARAAAALYFQGTSYKELAETLGFSAPRIGQLIKSNDQPPWRLLCRSNTGWRTSPACQLIDGLAPYSHAQSQY